MNIFKNKKQKKCESCGSKTEERYSFCPYCGNNFIDLKKERENFGLLGKDDYLEDQEIFEQNFGLTDKFIGTIMNSMMKNLDKQLRNQIENDIDKAEIKALPNGISIRIGGLFPQAQKQTKKQKVKKAEITQEQIKKMSALPRALARTNIKRLGNKLIYELSTPGLESVEDVFVSKLESGYEVKAIGNKKVYINTIPVNFPITKYSILDNKLSVEFVDQGV